jgi:hypothetical protein
MHSVYSMKTMTIWTHNLGELEFLMAILALISTNLNSSKLLLSKHPKPALQVRRSSPFDKTQNLK